MDIAKKYEDVVAERDAALAREAEVGRLYDSLVNRSNRERDASYKSEDALREELARYKYLFGQAQKAIDRLNELHPKRMGELAKRLTVAEKRASELEQLLQMFIDNSDDKDVVELSEHALKPAAEWYEEPLHPVEGDRLPAIGRKVFIRLSSSDSWVEHTVTGYYVWDDLQGSASLHRVFVRVRDGAGYHNARLLKDVRLSAEGEGS